jgi:hypothetical protein
MISCLWLQTEYVFLKSILKEFDVLNSINKFPYIGISRSLFLVHDDNIILNLCLSVPVSIFPNIWASIE